MQKNNTGSIGADDAFCVTRGFFRVEFTSEKAIILSIKKETVQGADDVLCISHGFFGAEFISGF